MGSKSVKVLLSTDRKRSYDWLTASKHKWLACSEDVCGDEPLMSPKSICMGGYHENCLNQLGCPIQLHLLTNYQFWLLASSDVELISMTSQFCSKACLCIFYHHRPFSLGGLLPHLRPYDDTLENSCFQILKYLCMSMNENFRWIKEQLTTEYHVI